MWPRYESVHAVTYFADECAAAFRAAGLKGFWMGYFAGRAAPMGAVGPAAVDAIFFNFHPGRVARALPDAWALAPPERVLDARLEGVDGALARIFGPSLSDPAMSRAAALLRAAVDGLVVDGRPLGAANAALEWPHDDHLMVWQAATILREHRGDGHVTALVEAGLDGRQALVSMAATGRVRRAMLQAARGWDDAAWDEAAADLVARGWLTPDGAATAAGAAARRAIEDTTDRLAAAPWARLGERLTAELSDTLAPMVDAIAAGGAVLDPNPIGLPVPSGPPR